jgi:hypothetical protein
VWKELSEELRAQNVLVVTVCLEVDPTKADKWLDAVETDATADSNMLNLIDTTHATAAGLGLINVPMAMWVEADGTIVRPAHHCPVSASPFAGKPIPEGLPPRMAGRVQLLADRPDRHAEYLAALRDWATNGQASQWSLNLDAATEASGIKTESHAMADAEFAVGEYLMRTYGQEAAVPHWRESHRLHPENLGYKRQAWSLITSVEGADVDLIQEDTGPYDGNWLDDCRDIGMSVLYPEFI